MSNKYRFSDKSVLLKKRLEKLSDRLVQANSLDDFQTNEQIISEISRIITLFYKDLTAPIFDPDEILFGDLPDPSTYNETFQHSINDLSVIFSELENIETLSISNFNFAATESNRVFSRLKSVSSKLADYILYSTDPIGDSIFFYGFIQ
jgi:hypothetical protein